MYESAARMGMSTRCGAVFLPEISLSYRNVDCTSGSSKGICLGFVIMPDHVPVLIWFPEVLQLSAFMDKWKDQTSRQLQTLLKFVILPNEPNGEFAGENWTDVRTPLERF